MTKQEQFLAKWEESFRDGSFVRGIFSGPCAPQSGGSPLSVHVRLVEIQNETRWSVTFRSQRGDTTQNFSPKELLPFVRNNLLPAYRTGLLGTTRKDWQLIQSGCSDAAARLVAHAPSTQEAPPRTHDRRKNSLLDHQAKDWLHQLDVVTAEGSVRASMADKHRQIHRYLEILGHHLKPDATERPFTVVDMGCGKGYLTFAVWHWIVRVCGHRGSVLGIDTRRDLIDRGNQVAQHVGASDLRFQCGTIQETEVGSPDVLIALHACNTATDDAILKGVRARATHILVAPCCHQDLRPKLGHPAPWDALLEHGILKERFAEWLSDGLRALYLQAAGYSVKVLEFVGTEHTPKNLLICASRCERTGEAERLRVVASIEKIQTDFGVCEHPLGALLRCGEKI